MTSAANVHVPPAGSVPPLSAKEVAPAAMAAGANPVQPEPVTVTGPPTAVRPAGNVSVNAADVSATALGFAIWMLSWVVPPAAMLAGLKPLVAVAGWRTVTSSAVEEVVM